MFPPLVVHIAILYITDDHHDNCMVAAAVGDLVFTDHRQSVND